MNKLGNKRIVFKVFNMNGVIFGAYKRSSARAYFEKNSIKYTGTFQYATYKDLQIAEQNIIDPENKYQK